MSRCAVDSRFDGGCVPPAGWAEAGVLISRPGMRVMSILAGCVLSPRDDGTVYRGGAGVRRAAVGAAAGALATRCWQSGTPWKL